MRELEIEEVVGDAASGPTTEFIENQNATLPFENVDDFTDANNGFLGTIDDGTYPIMGPDPDGGEEPVQIAIMEFGKLYAYPKDDDSPVIFDLKQYDFLGDQRNDGTTPDQGNEELTVNSSLWRQSQLNNKHGLFEVLVDKIYQVRGYDLANITFILTESTDVDKGKGWIVVDPLTCKETAAAAFTLLNECIVNEDLKGLSVVAVMSTHSHADHFGGIGGLIHESQLPDANVPGDIIEDVEGDIEVIDIVKSVSYITPEDFFEHAVSENLMAGNAMNQRASFMYGNACDKGIYGTVGSGLGQTTSEGTVTIMEPTKSIKETGERLKIGNVIIQFMLTPGAEAPDEYMFFVETYSAFCPAEEVNHTQHNLLTPRGAKVRDGLSWSKYIDGALQKWGDNIEIVFGSHHWPMWKGTGQEAGNIKDYMKKQRDLYKFIHDQSLRMANQGLTIQEIGEEIELPEALNTFFANRGYYGTLIHNAKAQYQMYFGWFDGNPASLYQLPPEELGSLYVRYMQNNVDSIIVMAQADYDSGKYREVVTILNNVVFSGKEYIGNIELVRELLAKAYTQLGYQSESGPWRNFFLSGAAVLRDAKREGTVLSMSDEFRLGITVDLYFDYMAMRVDGLPAADRTFLINWTFTDVKDVIDEKDKTAVSYLENGALTTRLKYKSQSSYGSAVIIDVELDKDAFSQFCLVPLDMLIDTETESLTDITGVKSISSEADFSEFLGLLDTLNTSFNIVTP